MKKTILFLATLVFSISLTKAQDELKPCYENLYKFAFEDSKLFKNKAAEIDIGYKPSEFVVNSIIEMKLFSKDEIERFTKSIDNEDYKPCAKLKKQVEVLLSDDRIRENGNYMVYFFSKIISLSNSKKVVLSSTSIRSKKHEGGKAIGDERIYIFNKEKDKWALEDKKIIATY
ncbi:MULTISPECIES: hypothetical protein [Aquimarina]|uniref:hypothetical protein n=1 Tax=Aquimarina TaxID=290174 RepID=UPI000D696A93|nr:MULTISPECIES: hypothetical protein [Aquimarina]